MTKLDCIRQSLYASSIERNNIETQVFNGIMTLDIANEKFKVLTKEIIQKKKLLIAEVHIGKRGNPLSMGTYNEKKKLYMVKCADREQLTSRTEEGLLDALMEHYGLSLDSPLIKDVFKRAMDRYTKRHPGKTKTIYNYNCDYKRLVSSELANMDIRNIDVDFLETYCFDLVERLNLKVKAFKNFKGLLNKIYYQAIYEGLVRENVAKMVDNRSIIQFCDQSLAHRKPEDLLYTDDALKMIFADMWDRIESNYSPYAFALLLQAELGCRPAELICLKWSDFNFDKKLVSIERQQIEHRIPKQSFCVVEFTKEERGVSQGGRLVPLSSTAINVLMRLKADKEKLGIDSEWLFTDKDGNLLKKKGYFDFNSSLHNKYSLRLSGSYAFRRRFSATLEQAGIGPSERGATLGHSSETNLRNYTSAKPDYLERIGKALG